MFSRVLYYIGRMSDYWMLIWPCFRTRIKLVYYCTGVVEVFDVIGAGRRPNFVVVRDRCKSKPALLKWIKRPNPFSEQATP
jgi:hypothetical protein